MEEIGALADAVLADLLAHSWNMMCFWAEPPSSYMPSNWRPSAVPYEALKLVKRSDRVHRPLHAHSRTGRFLVSRHLHD